MSLETPEDEFTSFLREVEPLRWALIAAMGVEAGHEATADALTYGWELWGRINQMGNPAGYRLTDMTRPLDAQNNGALEH